MTSEKIIEKYLLNDDMSSFDIYDIWKTKLGYLIKKGYNSNKFFYLLPAAILTVFDYFINNNYSTGFSGLCWGLNFAWPVDKKLEYDANEPFTTHTPYVLEAIDLYIELTSDRSFEIYIKKIFDYYENDVKVIKENDEFLAISYGTTHDRVITNAVSYTLFAYTIFSKYIHNTKIEKKIIKLYNFIKINQLKNGAWFYMPNKKNSFIDCFHTCFILKNLIKSNHLNKINGADVTIKKGLNYLLENFHDNKFGLYKRFSISNKPSIVKFDLYDNAETLNLFQLLDKNDDFKRLNKSIVKNFFFKDDIYSIVDVFNNKKFRGTLRWAIIPYLRAISKSI